MKYSKAKKTRKDELRELNEQKAPISPGKKKLIRFCAELGAVLAGVVVIFLSRVLFNTFVMGKAESEGVLAVTRDNFELYFKISLILSAVLLALTVMSALTYLFQKEISRFQRITVSASPVICSVSVLAVAVFYAYLTSGGAVSIFGYLVALGIGEALLFRLPCAMYVAIRKPEGKAKKSKGKGNK